MGTHRTQTRWEIQLRSRRRRWLDNATSRERCEREWRLLLESMLLLPLPDSESGAVSERRERCELRGTINYLDGSEDVELDLSLTESGGSVLFEKGGRERKVSSVRVRKGWSASIETHTDDESHQSTEKH